MKTVAKRCKGDNHIVRISEYHQDFYFLKRSLRPDFYAFFQRTTSTIGKFPLHI